MSDKGTEEDFFDKIEWEGGVYEALDYGLSADEYDLSETVKERWSNLTAAHKLLRPLVEDFEADYLV